MTAGISFEVEERRDTLKIPNAALRFYPESKYVREPDRKLLDGAAWEQEAQETPERPVSAHEKAAARRDRNRRHVWVDDGDTLRAIEVIVGLTDSRFSELVSGPLREQDRLVIGIEPKKAWGL
jgi:HlyD family secretion protein